MHAPHTVTLVTRIFRLGRQHTLLHADKSLHQLEGRARRIFGLHGAVEQRLALVAQHAHIVVAALAPHQLVGIIRRRGGHNQNLARRGLDGHHSPHLARHELLGKRLKACVDRTHQTLARHGQRIERPVHI